MTRDVAHVQLTGRIGHTPELKYLPSGDPVTTFSLAVNRGTKDEDVTDWYRVSCYGQTAEFVTGYLDKGRKVLVIGRQEIRQWEGRDGVKRKEVEVKVSELVPIDSRRGTNRPSQTLASGPEEQDLGPDQEMPF